MNRSGFALLAVLWTVTLLAAAVGLAAAAARVGQDATANRIALARGRWAAEACLAIAEARAVSGPLADTATVDLGRTTTCAWTVEFPDGRLDANHATREMLERLGSGAGLDREPARAFADAVVAARATAELTDVAQLEDLPRADHRLLEHLTIHGSGRIDALTAAPLVLASLPGMTPEAVDVVVRRRRARRRLASLDELAGVLSPAARAALHARYADLAPLLRFDSSRLLLRAQGWVGSRGPYPRVTIALVVQRLPDRLAVLHRRMQ